MADDVQRRCQKAIAPIVAQYLSTPSHERNEMVLTKLILAALGDLDVLSEGAYEFIDQVRACIISAMTDEHDVAPEAEIVGALTRKGFIVAERPEAVLPNHRRKRDSGVRRA